MGRRSHRGGDQDPHGAGRRAHGGDPRRPPQGRALRGWASVEFGDQCAHESRHDRFPQRRRRHAGVEQGGLSHRQVRRNPEQGMSDDFDYPVMARALILGDKDTVARKTKEGLELSMDPKDLIFRGLIPGMDVVGEKFRRTEYYVPQVLLSARAMYAGLDLLKPLLIATSTTEYLGTVVIGTAQGDLHDIGKNLVAMMLEGAGFKVVNLGRDVSPEKFCAA